MRSSAVPGCRHQLPLLSSRNKIRPPPSPWPAPSRRRLPRTGHGRGLPFFFLIFFIEGRSAADAAAAIRDGFCSVCRLRFRGPGQCWTRALVKPVHVWAASTAHVTRTSVILPRTLSAQLGSLSNPPSAHSPEAEEEDALKKKNRERDRGSHGHVALARAPGPAAGPPGPPGKEAGPLRPRLPGQLVLRRAAGRGRRRRRRALPGGPAPPLPRRRRRREGVQDEDAQGVGEAVQGDGDGEDRAALRREAASAQQEERQAQEEALQDGPS